MKEENIFMKIVKRVLKIVLIIIGCLFILGIVIGLFVPDSEKSESISSTEKMDTKKQDTKKSKKPTIYEQMELTEEEYNAILPVFEQCGFTEITKVEKDEADNKGIIPYYIEMKDVEPSEIISPGVTKGNLICIEITSEKELKEIDVNFIPIYKDGKVIAPVKKYIKLTYQERDTCRDIARFTIQNMLKNPDGAKFCSLDDYRWGLENGIITAQGYVDATNGFGAVIRSTFVLTYDRVNEKPITLVFEGNKIKF